MAGDDPRTGVAQQIHRPLARSRTGAVRRPPRSRGTGSGHRRRRVTGWHRSTPDKVSRCCDRASRSRGDRSTVRRSGPTAPPPLIRPSVALARRLPAPLTQTYLTGYSPLNRNLVVGSGGAHGARDGPSPRRSGHTVSAVVELTPTRPFPPRRGVKGSFVYRVLTTTDPKLLGIMYTVTSVAFFMAGGLMALLMRSELGAPGVAVLVQRAVQPAVHHARHDHAAAVCHPDRVRLRQLHSAASDRRARRGVPAAERAQLLAVSVRRAGHRAGFLTPGGAADFGWTAYTPLSDALHSPGRRRRSVDHGPGRRRSGHHPGCGQHDHHRRLHARARDDDVSDADLHLEHPGHQRHDADRVPAADRRAARVGGRPAPGRSHL